MESQSPVKPRPILIAHVVFRLDYGGLENGLVNLINGLPDDKYRHVIICLKDATDFQRRLRKTVEIVPLHKREGHDMAMYLRLWKYLRKRKPDIVHTRNLAALETQVVAVLAGIPYRIHGEHGRDVHDLDNTKSRYRLLRKVFSLFVQHYITVSRELADYLITSVGVRSERVTPICNGVDAERFHPGCARDVLNEAPFDASGRVIIGTVGRMQAVKDHVTLAAAFIALCRRFPGGQNGLGLVIVGDGPERAAVEHLLREAGVTDAVWLPGTRDDTPALLRSFDIFVLPSLAEGISNTILEAMATGLPVVATAVGGNPELVMDGETGSLVPRADPDAMAHALEQYCRDPDLRSRHGRNARMRVERDFSLPVMIEKYDRVYQNLVAA